MSILLHYNDLSSNYTYFINIINKHKSTYSSINAFSKIITKHNRNYNIL